jgi:translation initiation factor IF-3
LDRLVGDLGDMVTVESMPKQEGRNMIMVISPNKRHLEQLARAKALESQQQPESGPQPEPEPLAGTEPVVTAIAPDTDER